MGARGAEVVAASARGVKEGRRAVAERRRARGTRDRERGRACSGVFSRALRRASKRRGLRYALRMPEHAAIPHLVSLQDLSEKQVEDLLDLSLRIKKRAGAFRLEAKSVGLLFFRGSLRTR